MGLSLVIADHCVIVRLGIQRLLEAETGLTLRGQAGDGIEALALVERMRPDVALIDLALPALHGLDVLKGIGERAPGTRVIVLCNRINHPEIRDALKGGAMGVVLKSASEQELIRAITEVAQGKRYLSPDASHAVLDAYLDQIKEMVEDVHETLTVREREVLQLAAEGAANQDIARRLHISHRTVENHRSAVMRKLGLKNYPDLVRYAIRRGLISLDT